MADGRQILEIVMGGSGGAGGGVADGGASGGSNPLSSIAKKLGVSQENQKDTANATQGMAKGMTGFVKNQLGISFSLANILKQSQIFTSFVGSIFQIFGALVDVILAPFLPVLIPIITSIGSWIPWVQQKAQEMANGLFTFFGWLGSVWGGAVAIWNKVNELLEPIKGWISSVKGFVEKWTEDLTIGNIVIAITRIWETAGAKIVSIVDGLWANLKGIIDEVSKITGEVPGKIWNLVWIGLKWMGRSMVTLMDNAVKAILGAMPGGAILKLLYAGIKGIFKFFGRVFLSLAKLLLRFGKWAITEGIPRLVGAIKGFFGKMAGQVLGIFKSIASKLPFGMGKVFKNMGTNLPMMGKIMKRIPVVGTVAQLGFGAVETYKATQKYGLKGGLAFGAKNLAAAGAGIIPGAGTVAAAGIDIGGTIALTKYFDAQLAKEKEASNTINVTVVNEGGTIQEETFVEKTSQNANESSYNSYLSGQKVR